jgi:CheY-like chemotaxis protein
MPESIPLKKKILVVDDEPLVCEAIEMMLAFDGYEVVAASNGQEALALFEPGKFDLVVTDYTMPGMKGDELALAVKALMPGQPVIMITAHAELLRASAVALAGVDEVVSKPFQFQDIRDAIKKVLTR